MHRSKLLVIALATMMAAAGGYFLTGGATATKWHDYKGDLHPGHAYAVAIPARAESLEISFLGNDGGSARLSVFDPAGGLVGHYQLGAGPTVATIARPDAGDHAIYVYEAKSGALSLRVNAPDAPALELRKLDLARDDIVLARVDAPDAFDRTMTAKLASQPVFVTLLYEGSVDNLHATVSSPRGDVFSIANEYGTAFSPGVWSSLAGERKPHPAALSDGTYTVNARADRFEGTLVLTTLSIRAPAAPVMPVPKPAHPGHGGAIEGSIPIPPSGAVVLPLDQGVPLAFTAAAGKLRLALMGTDYGNRYHDSHAVVLLYAPDDTFLSQIHLDTDNAVAEIDLDMDGEYVAYLSTVYEGSVFLALDTVAVNTAPRALALVEETFQFRGGQLLGNGFFGEFEILQTPLELQLRIGHESIGALNHIRVMNDHGDMVAETHAPATLYGGGWWDCAVQNPEAFRAGIHHLQVDGVAFDGVIELKVLAFDRAETLVAEHATHAHHDDDHGHGDDGDRSTSAPSRLPAIQRILDALR